MTELDGFKQKILDGKISKDDAINELIKTLEGTKEFIDSLIAKHKEYKTKSFENMKNYPESPMNKYQAAIFDSSVIYIFELEDTKCRNGIWNDNEK